jgi:hypothetical protein
VAETSQERQGAPLTDSLREPNTAASIAMPLHVGVSPGMLRALGALALVSAFLARGLAPALPGTRAGIGTWITLTERTSAVLSGWLLVAAVVIATWLLLGALRERGLGVVYRLAMVPASAAIITLVMASLRKTLEPEMALVLGMTAGVVALASTPVGLVSPRTRAAALVLGLEGAATIAHVNARSVAMRASEQAMTHTFELARGISTVAFALDVAAIGIATLWVVWPKWRSGVVVVAALFAVASVLTWGALEGSRPGAATWQVLASRTLAEMTREPSPLVLPFLRYLVEPFAVGLAAWVLFGRRRSTAVYVATALVLTSRANTDIPLLALLMVLASLLLALSAVGTSNTLER